MELPGAGTETSPSDERLPRAFGRYVLFDHIGRGGMADIYLARARTSLGGARLAVVKQILPQLSDDQRFSELLTAEAKLAANLNHANVVQVFDLGRESGRLFIGMEYVEGFDLNQLLRRLTKARIGLPAEFAIFIIREALRALDYAHRAKGADGVRLDLVHRDVSPSNVLISFEGEVKLCDFGIARALRENSGDDSATHLRIAGKSAYMAPEHARGDTVDARSDVFAAGILLWELCAGRRLYKGAEHEMLEKARAGDVPPLPERGLPNHERLQKVLSKMLEKDAKYRFSTAAEALRELEDYGVASGLLASPLRFGQFLTDNFADEIVAARRERERSAEALTGSGELELANVGGINVDVDAERARVASAASNSAGDSGAGDSGAGSSGAGSSGAGSSGAGSSGSGDGSRNDSDDESGPVDEARGPHGDESGPHEEDSMISVTGSLTASQIVALQSGEHRLEAALAATTARVKVKRLPPPESDFSNMWFVKVAAGAVMIFAAVYYLLS